MAVRIEGLRKSFTAQRGWREMLRRPFGGATVDVLRGVDLTVPQGGFFGLLGPNGAGKTTLFKILATLVVPDSGRVTVAGRSVTRDPRGVRSVLTPVIADERSLHWRLTARANLELFAALYGVPGSERVRRTEELLGIVGLTESAARMVGTFSSGMKQRLLIARALLSRPEILLLDEPTRSLDPVSARDFRRFLKEEVAGRQGCTVLLATHDADEAFELCDRLAILDGGTLVAQGTASELRRTAGENRYRILVPLAAADRALGRLAEDGFAHVSMKSDLMNDSKDWVTLEGEFPGGRDAVAQAIAGLGSEGVLVAEATPVPLPLADLIERTTTRGTP